MKQSLDTLRVRLIQARDEPDIAQGERDCFVERCRLRPDQFAVTNVVRDAVSEALLDDVDALLIGGAGSYSAIGDYPWMVPLLSLCRAAGRRKLPTFGSCWGHQLLARAYGGAVAYDKERAELGCHSVALTEAGQQDPLFGAFPRQFKANMGHHDRITHLPPNAVELAYNTSQRFQAFRIDGQPIYGTQFHSELDADRERERLIAYRDFYSEEIGSDAAFAQIMNSLADTSEVDHLLHDFLLRFAVKEPTCTR